MRGVTLYMEDMIELPKDVTNDLHRGILSMKRIEENSFKFIPQVILIPVLISVVSIISNDNNDIKNFICIE